MNIVKLIHIAVSLKHLDEIKTSIEILPEIFQVYKGNNNFTKEGYELLDIQFWAHMRSQNLKPYAFT